MAQSRSKNAYRVWCAAGKPRLPSNVIRSHYKECKRLFHRELRKYKRGQEDEFDKSLDLSDRSLYHQVRLRRGLPVMSTNRLSWNGCVFEGDVILNGWASYFKSLTTPNDDLDGCSIDNLLKTELELSDILSQVSLFSGEEVVVLPEQVRKCILALSVKKVAGPDYLTAEHFINGPIDTLSSFCAPLFSAMINLRFVPASFTSSFIIPILKGKHLDVSNPGNYRGISISSTFSKLFELIILDLISPILTPILHPLQGGFRKGYSTSNTSFIVQEAILSCRELKLKCYSGFLDARKAFDTVWHSGLFVKLYKLGIVGNIWWVLYYWYNHISSSVKWNNTLSTSFQM